MDPAGALARRFPLVARPRPACVPLETRVSALCKLADSAQRGPDSGAASSVFNQAALLASDVGLRDLARRWCHRHAALYLQRHPLNTQAAVRGLEPLVNMARLHIRDGHGHAALQLLNDLFHAVSTRTDLVVDGLEVPAATLTAAEEDHRQVRQWLWSVLLSDGTRALTTAGRWQDAYTHLRTYKGIGSRMLDGRQVAVIAGAASGETDHALDLLQATVPGEPWEQAVTATLTVVCQQDEPQEVDLQAMLKQYRQIVWSEGTAVFHTRLGLSVFEALRAYDHHQAKALVDDLVDHVLKERNGYCARELLHHTVIGSAPHDGLFEVVTSCGLDLGRLPEDFQLRLSAALDGCGAVLARVHASPA